MTQQSGAGSPQQFCLRWNNYQSNLTNVFDQLLQSESFVDVTLACDGHSVKAHKMVLSACSPYFQALFFENPCQHPIVIMKDIKWPELKAAVEFMYKGEINVSQEQIGPLLKVAENLKIRGLADVNSEQELTSRPSLVEEATNAALHRKKRRRISGERSPTGNSPDHTGSAGSTTGGTGSMIDDQEPSGPVGMVIPEVHALIPNSSTPRSLGSPSTPSVSVTPQINLQELPKQKRKERKSTKKGKRRRRKSGKEKNKGELVRLKRWAERWVVWCLWEEVDGWRKFNFIETTTIFEDKTCDGGCGGGSGDGNSSSSISDSGGGGGGSEKGFSGLCGERVQERLCKNDVSTPLYLRRARGGGGGGGGGGRNAKATFLLHW
ncbi:hypothetical protein M0802_001767 [Mischocyttarus mexicanus]|nr:hypothetical protein M0802_001767 [Mischocyttarus mexicanus]